MKALDITLSQEGYHHLVTSLEQSCKKSKQTEEEYGGCI